jgi:hypothetical protein
MKRNKAQILIMVTLSLMFMIDSCNSQEMIKIKMRYVSLDILTPIEIDCNSFDTLFNNQISTIEIINKEDIDAIQREVKNLKIDTTNYLPDVRVKLEVIYPDSIKVYCLSNFGLSVDGKGYILSDTLLNVLRQYMKQ